MINWQPMKVQPFDPANPAAAIIERRKRLMGVTRPRNISRMPPAPASTTAPAPFVGVQQNHHVKAWEAWQDALPIGRCRRYVAKRCMELGFSYGDIIGTTRQKRLIPTRHLLMWELRNLLEDPPSLQEIAVIFNKRDHTGVWCAIDKIEQRKRAGEL